MDHRFNPSQNHQPHDDGGSDDSDDSSSLINPFVSPFRGVERIRQRAGKSVQQSLIPPTREKEDEDRTTKVPSPVVRATNTLTNHSRLLFDPYYAPNKKFDYENPDRHVVQSSTANTGLIGDDTATSTRRKLQQNTTGPNRYSGRSQSTNTSDHNKPKFSIHSFLSQNFRPDGTFAMPSLHVQGDTSEEAYSAGSNKEDGPLGGQTYGTTSARNVLDVYEYSDYVATPGINGVLEIEEEEPIHEHSINEQGTSSSGKDEDLLGLEYEPVRTTSGLLLTHRRTPPQPKKAVSTPSKSVLTSEMNAQQGSSAFARNIRTTNTSNSTSRVPNTSHPVNFLHPFTSTKSVFQLGNDNPSSLDRHQQNRLLSYVRIWLAAFFVLLVTGLGIACLAIQHERRGNLEKNKSMLRDVSRITTSVSPSENDEILQEASNGTINRNASRMALAQPLISEVRPSRRTTERVSEGELEGHDVTRNLRRLKEDFEDWIERHTREYETEEEKERRFQIWTENHHRTIDKNQRHGPCKLTGKPVFGDNHFKDLTQEEFKQRFLTGYRGPHTPTDPTEYSKTLFGKHGRPLQNDDQRKDPRELFHPQVHKSYIENRGSSKTNSQSRTSTRNGYTASSDSWYDCGYLDFSCWLQWLFDSYPYGSGDYYDISDLPEAFDWRDVGAVTSVHSQGNCGACWAITAVETIESAYFLSTGDLVDLAETEVITCEDECQMCYGGWPQNAYDYVAKNNGLPQRKTIGYDGDFLLALTMVTSGESDEVSQSYVDSYKAQICPAEGGNKNNDDDGSSSSRYAAIKSYSYGTERCICYTNGSGCGCEDQNEAEAIKNLASYGPATVCLEASTWQDYSGGVITADSGCTQEFMDMNHCVQLVGYAFYDTEEEEEEEEEGSGSGSGSHRSNDNENKEGYWIVRNQWSSYWGHSGYAYVAMGGENVNTCGILNDMTQAFME